MGKLDVGVGDEFPVDEPPPPSQECEDTMREARAEWEQRKAEWHRRKDEWRVQREAWRDDMRARRDAFKADMRKSFYEHFGTSPPRTNTILVRGAVAIGVVLVVIALLPVLFMFGLVALGAAIIFFALTGGRGTPSSNNPVR